MRTGITAGQAAVIAVIGLAVSLVVTVNRQEPPAEKGDDDAFPDTEEEQPLDIEPGAESETRKRSPSESDQPFEPRKPPKTTKGASIKY